MGADSVGVVSRNGEINYTNIYNETDTEIIVNTTPVGMYPDNMHSPVVLENFLNLKGVFDVVYNPLRTKLVLDAQKSGIYASGGLLMLVSQAVRAIELFLDKPIDESKAEEIYTKILKEKENIILVGMPSSGKTTVGKILAKETNRELVDLDCEIENHIGCTIAEFFKSHTEKDFRDIETQITKEISKKNGIIISTGGGCILRDENVSALRSNGRLYFLNRSLENLTPTDSRPLATKKEALQKLYNERYHIYINVSDVEIDGNLSPEMEAKIIREEFLK
jgi:shikimate dehydrogenase